MNTQLSLSLVDLINLDSHQSLLLHPKVSTSSTGISQWASLSRV
jgi:hypothetical protein